LFEWYLLTEGKKTAGAIRYDGKAAVAISAIVRLNGMLETE